MSCKIATPPVQWVTNSRIVGATLVHPWTSTTKQIVATAHGGNHGHFRGYTTTNWVRATIFGILKTS
jgi:hypothetical protein